MEGPLLGAQAATLGRLVAELEPAGTLAEIFLSVKALFPLADLGQQELRVNPEGSKWREDGL